MFFFFFLKAYVVRDPLKYMSGPTPEMLDVNLSFSDKNYHRTELYWHNIDKIIKYINKYIYVRKCFYFVFSES